MGLSSIFKRKTEAPGASQLRQEAPGGGRRPRRGASRAANSSEPVAPSTFGQEPVDEVQRARSRARHRLIGAVVLLGIGVVGFPLVFETQPRPIPVDIPIEIPRREGAPPLTNLPGTAPETAPELAAERKPQPASAAVPTPPDDVITESREDAAPGTSGHPADAAPPHGAAPRATASAPAARPTADAARTTADGARAQALLEGKPAPATPASSAARFVVQIGAFADPNAAQDTRLKVEKLGLKTYTQVASTAAGGRTRVRVGPFASRDEADKALAKARGAGLSAVVITL